MYSITLERWLSWNMTGTNNKVTETQKLLLKTNNILVYCTPGAKLHLATKQQLLKKVVSNFSSKFCCNAI